MRQYHGIKQQVPNALLLFRLGQSVPRTLAVCAALGLAARLV